MTDQLDIEITQIQCIGPLGMWFFFPYFNFSLSMSKGVETGNTPSFCLIGIDRENFVITAAGMGNMVLSTTH